MAEVAEARQDKLARPTTFPAMLDRYKNEIARALPRHLNPDRMARIALVARNGSLESCSRSNSGGAACTSKAGGLKNRSRANDYENERSKRDSSGK